jgi:hypothetical protein
MTGSGKSPDQKKMAPYIMPVRVENLQKIGARRAAFAFHEPLEEDFFLSLFSS